VPRYLADTSAWTRSQATAELAERWATLVQLDEIALCEPVELELLYSASGPADYRVRRDELAGLPRFPFDRRAVKEALRTQEALAARSRRRGPAPIDLFVAAIARISGSCVLHYDKHFDAIARATGQPTEWLARRGSLD
jgi:predicted nucleic acid-binding protein